MEDSIEDLRRISARLGNNSKHIQGAGGNTSIKLDGVLWVKASGTWLSNALHQQLFVPLDLAVVREQLKAGAPDPLAGSIRADLAPPHTVPSIETSLHAILPHKVVAHTHSVAVIAAAIRRDAEQVLIEKLSGYAYTFVPYARPGTPLTRAVCEAMSDGVSDVFILGNHGLVVGAQDCASALAMVEDIERRLVSETRVGRGADVAYLSELSAGTAFMPAPGVSSHWIATDPVSSKIASGGSLYPDHVVFLGPGITILDGDEPVRWRDEGLRSQPVVLSVAGRGVLVRVGTTPAALAMIECLAAVLALVPGTASINYLTHDQEVELLGWDAEKIRQGLNR